MLYDIRQTCQTSHAALRFMQGRVETNTPAPAPARVVATSEFNNEKGVIGLIIPP